MLAFGATGAGHLLGFNQFYKASKQTFELDIAPTADKQELKTALVSTLNEHNLFVPNGYERTRDGRFSLNSAKFAASIGANKNGKMVVEYAERTWFGTLYSMHFGHGGKFFSALTIAFLVFILVIYLSGFIITAWCKHHRNRALLALLAGSILLVGCYFNAINL